MDEVEVTRNGRTNQFSITMVQGDDKGKTSGVASNHCQFYEAQFGPKRTSAGVAAMISPRRK